MYWKSRSTTDFAGIFACCRLSHAYAIGGRPNKITDKHCKQPLTCATIRSSALQQSALDVSLILVIATRSTERRSPLQDCECSTRVLSCACFETCRCTIVRSTAGPRYLQERGQVGRVANSSRSIYHHNAPPPSTRLNNTQARIPTRPSTRFCKAPEAFPANPA